jgi:hypothetical protein
MAYVDDHMQDGDIILVEKRETAENGESLVAMISGERVTLKPPHYAHFRHYVATAHSYLINELRAVM